MCGRIAQYTGIREMVDALSGWPQRERFRVPQDAQPRYNVGPATPVAVLHVHDDEVIAEQVRWGWAPHWAQGKPAAINARVEGVASSNYFRTIWKHGRALVPADGWYEWKANEDNPKQKQPYYLRLAGGGPLFFAGLGQFPVAGAEPGDLDGFVILTGEADGALAQVHDRKPLVLMPDEARAWADPATTTQEAEDIARYHAATAEAFEWYPVSHAVGNVRNDGPELITPLP